MSPPRIKVPPDVEEGWRLDRLRVIQDIAAILARMEEMGENDMGHLSYNEANSFHATTHRLRHLVDRLNQHTKGF